ncbi:MAG: HNH endonuclease signature motif containing protein, partial [Pseudonocardiales bacterium]
RTYQRAVRERAVHGYLDHTGTAVLTGSGLPAADAAAAAARLEALADDLRAAGYPATVGQARADLYLRLLDGTLDGLTRQQILATMLRLGPVTPADGDPDAERSQGERDHESPERQAPEQPMPPNQPEGAEQPRTGCPDEIGTSGPVKYGIEVRVRLSTLLGVDEHPAELPGWGPIPAATARDLVAAQHNAEWRIAIVDTQGYLLHGDLTRRRPTRPGARDDRIGGIVEIALPVSMLDQFPALAAEHPQWARVLHGISGSWQHRGQARAALDQHPHRRFAHAALRRHVQMRDRHCVGIGCRRRATTSDLDHTRDHAHGGPTVTTNSGPNCGRHHTMKHQGGWTLQQPQAGHFIWTSPLGQTYRTRGEPLTPDLPQPLPRDVDPDPPGIPMMFEGPILHPPQPPPPARPPPAALPDQPPF